MVQIHPCPFVGNWKHSSVAERLHDTQKVGGSSPFASTMKTTKVEQPFSIQPFGNKVIIHREAPKARTESGLYLPTESQEKPQFAKVVAVGPGTITLDGNRVAMRTKVGDTVMLAKWTGVAISVDGKDYLVLSEDELLGIKVS